MKYLKINIKPIKIKGDPDDTETLQTDLFERLSVMIESDSLEWSIDEEDEDDEE